VKTKTFITILEHIFTVSTQIDMDIAWALHMEWIVLITLGSPKCFVAASSFHSFYCLGWETSEFKSSPEVCTGKQWPRTGSAAPSDINWRVRMTIRQHALICHAGVRHDDCAGSLSLSLSNAAASAPQQLIRLFCGFRCKLRRESYITRTALMVKLCSSSAGAALG
jgi:hypothetical protein